jgi:hypothetical protein
MASQAAEKLIRAVGWVFIPDTKPIESMSALQVAEKLNQTSKSQAL